jgi:hypothetical protein
MEPHNLVDHLLQRLAAGPARIAHAAARLSVEEKRTSQPEGEWTAADILAHIRASDDILTFRLYAVLARDNPPLAAYDERNWAEVAGYAHSDFGASLQVYSLCRAELVDMLRGVALEDWQRTGVHELKGSLTLLDILTSLVEHEEEHCLQMESMNS